MHKTAEQWAKVKAASVTAGSVAQATNVLQMALDDIACLYRTQSKTQTEHDPAQEQSDD